MALIVGVDTYITLQEANEYVKKYYSSTDPLRIQWEAMSEDDQEIFLRKSFAQINSLPYVGKPRSPKQVNPFPRAGDFTEQDLLHIKYAQVEQALTIPDTVAAQETEDQLRLRLRRAGVTSYKIGDLSESFVDGLPAESNANFYGLTEAAYKHLSKWLRGGYSVCTSIKEHCGRL